MPDPAELLDENGAVRAQSPLVFVWLHPTMVDVDDAMEAWAELASRLPITPLFPVDGLSQMLHALAPVLVDHPLWSEIVEAVDDAVARTQGGAAAAGHAWRRANSLHDANRLREALRELHRAKRGYWSGDTIRGALLVMLLISDCYSRLNLPTAAKQYALAVVGLARRANESVLDLISAGLLAAAAIDYSSGAWCSALELTNLGLVQERLLVDEAKREMTESRDVMAVYNLGMMLHAAALIPGVGSRPEEIAENHRFLEQMQDMMKESVWDMDTHTRYADDQLRGRPFSDLGARRIIRFRALGLEWRVRCANDYRNVLAAERLAAGAQIMAVDFGDDDLRFLRTTIDVEIELLEEGQGAEKARAELQPGDDCRRWHVRLTPFTPGKPADPGPFLKELVVVLSTIFVDASQLSPERYIEAFDRAEERGLWHKIGTVRLYDELAAVVPEDFFNAIPRHEMKPLGDPTGGPAREHPELAWQE
jgi:hypothetical protein